jgi:hypothetical protein
MVFQPFHTLQICKTTVQPITKMYKLSQTAESKFHFIIHHNFEGLLTSRKTIGDSGKDMLIMIHLQVNVMDEDKGPSYTTKK